ncbi:hypothetical protein ACFL9S_00900 [Erwinia sp. AnSW2-5]|uniref:hypothetical protein n=1 Tax=Erwinia sp. AnSW2-5 TaxID=3367692 RepID=UPI003859FE13
MSNTRNENFQNHWLNMLDSVEENLTYYCRARVLSDGVASVNGGKTPQTNEWLNCASSAENVLQTLSLKSKNLGEKITLLRGESLVSGRAYRLILRFQSLRTRLAERTTSAQTRELYAEYCQLADQIMPTLARINKRVAARRQMLDISGDERWMMSHPADDTIDVALRAVQKQRI